MSQPTTGVYFNSSDPAAPRYNQNVVPQSDGETPEQSVTFFPQQATATLLGTIRPDNVTTSVASDGTLSASASGDANFIQALQQEIYVFAVDNGTANAYAVDQEPPPTIVQGSKVVFLAANSNTGPSTLSIGASPVTPIAITKEGSMPLVGGEIVAGQIIEAIFDGTNFQIVSGGSGSISTVIGGGTGQPDVIPSGAINGSNVTYTIPALAGGGTPAGNLYVSGVLQNPLGSTPDYTIIGNVITMANAPVATPTTDWLLWVYSSASTGTPGTGSGGDIFFGQGQATAATGNNIITLGSVPLPGSLSVFVQGLILPPTAYSVFGALVTLGSSLTSGNVVVANWATTNPAPGGIALSSNVETVLNVQSNVAVSLSVATPSDVTAGNLLVVMLGFEGTLGTATCSDTLGTSYTRRINQTSADGNNTVIFSGIAPSSGPCTATVAGTGGGSFIQTSISEFEGALDVVDTSTSGDGNASTPTALSITTTFSGDLIFMAVSGNHNTTTYSAGSGYTMNNFINGSDAQATQWQQQASAGSISGTFGASGNDDYSMAMIAFKAA